MVLDFTVINALLKAKYIPMVTDQFFRSQAFWALMRGKVKPWEGVHYVAPISVGGITGGSHYSGFETFTPSQITPIGPAVWTGFDYGFPIIFSEEQLNKFMGSETKVVDFIDARMQIIRETINAYFSAALYAGAGAGANMFLGMDQIFHQTNIYGGINRATSGNEYWRALVDTSVNERPLTTSLMRTNYLRVSEGTIKPGLILTSDAQWDRYSSMCENKLVLSANGRMLADLGFQVLEFMGTPIVPDKDCPAGHMIMLNLDWLELRANPGCNFTLTDWAYGYPDTVTRGAFILWNGQLLTTQPRRHVRIANLTV
ncbi:MAG: hypothetical protein DDT41_01168 [candidate division WS2 bacterium]|nr:hypothetical protein [Candidatus Psychracetigena formicireducens]